MINAILVLVIVLLVGGAAAYIYKEKKSGAKCIGCPSGRTCGGSCSACGGCSHSDR